MIWVLLYVLGVLAVIINFARADVGAEWLASVPAMVFCSIVWPLLAAGLLLLWVWLGPYYLAHYAFHRQWPP